MNTFGRTLAVLGLVLTGVDALQAHHSSPALVDTRNVITAHGTVVKVNWGNPHASVEIQLSDPNGKSLRWFLEGGSPAELAARKIERTAIKAGDTITACGYQGRAPRSDGSFLLSTGLIILENGRTLNFGRSGIGECFQPPRPSRFSETGAPLGPGLSRPVTTPPAAPPAAAMPLGSPRNGTTRAAPQPATTVPMRIPQDAVELAYLELYDRDKPVQITGKVTRVDWTSPNTYIFLMVGGIPWVVESSFIQFRQVAASPAIRVGDTIEVSGYLPQDNPRDQLPGRSHTAAGSYLRNNRLIRGSEITIYNGQKVALGEPPTREELERRARCKYSPPGCQ
jgi:hypothetical protein